VVLPVLPVIPTTIRSLILFLENLAISIRDFFVSSTEIIGKLEITFFFSPITALAPF